MTIRQLPLVGSIKLIRFSAASIMNHYMLHFANFTKKERKKMLPSFFLRFESPIMKTTHMHQGKRGKRPWNCCFFHRAHIFSVNFGSSCYAFSDFSPFNRPPYQIPLKCMYHGTYVYQMSFFILATRYWIV